MMVQLFDVVLVFTVVWLAWSTLRDRDLFRAVLKFIALGLLLSVAWVRLLAPDVALAEVAVSSALTGALLLSALARMKRRRAEAIKPDRGAPP